MTGRRRKNSGGVVLILVILVLLLIGGGVWYFFFMPKKGCMDPLFQEYDVKYTEAKPSDCVTPVPVTPVPVEGCMDPLFEEYDLKYTEAKPSDCVTPVPVGCENPVYMEVGTTDACKNLKVMGCTNPLACNYNEEANTGDTVLCSFPESNFDCDDNCLVDEDCDGVCGGDAIKDACGVCGGDGSTCEGCMDPTAKNFDPDAITHNGNCVAGVPGCTTRTAYNYDPGANTNDGSCVPTVLGCMDETASNYKPAANTDDGNCTYQGCMDPSAKNFDAAATVHVRAECVWKTRGCWDPTATNYDRDTEVNAGPAFCDYAPVPVPVYTKQNSKSGVTAVGMPHFGLLDERSRKKDWGTDTVGNKHKRFGGNSFREFHVQGQPRGCLGGRPDGCQQNPDPIVDIPLPPNVEMCWPSGDGVQGASDCYDENRWNGDFVGGTNRIKLCKEACNTTKNCIGFQMKNNGGIRSFATGSDTNNQACQLLKGGTETVVAEKNILNGWFGSFVYTKPTATPASPPPPRAAWVPSEADRQSNSDGWKAYQLGTNWRTTPS